MNSVSEPPINFKPDRHEKPVTFADVAMRIANDGPMYAAIALVGILSLQGKATASEMVITSLASLLARSWPRAVNVGGAGRAAMFLPLLLGGAIATRTLACTPPTASSTPASAPTAVHASISGR